MELREVDEKWQPEEVRLPLEFSSRRSPERGLGALRDWGRREVQAGPPGEVRAGGWWGEAEG